jgi:CBS domain-containing protein
MANTLSKPAPRVVLWAENARDLMMPDPVSIRARATIREAMGLLIDKGYSAAPVIDDAGRPVGVLSRTDLIIHEREKVEHVTPAPEYYERGELVTQQGEPISRGFQVEKVDRTLVRDLMTPVIFSVTPETPAAKVISEMLALKVHRLFVVDKNGVLVGVISALDILRHLHA